MVILCWNEKKARGALAKAEAKFTELGVEMNKEKTKLRHVKEGFDFLGFTFKQGYSKSLKRMAIVKFPRAKSLKKIRQKMKDLLKKTPRGTNLGEVISKVNSRIRGWANYFKIGNSYKAALDLTSYTCDQLRIFWRRRKHKKRMRGYAKWPNSFFYGKGLLYGPKLLRV